MPACRIAAQVCDSCTSVLAIDKFDINTVAKAVNTAQNIKTIVSEL